MAKIIQDAITLSPQKVRSDDDDDDVSSAVGDICLCFICSQLGESVPPSHSQHPAPSPKIQPYSQLKSLPLGHKSLSEGRSLGASAEGGTTHGDLRLATGDGGRAQGCCALPAGDRRVSHHDLGLVSLDRCAPQVEGRLALCETGVTHGGTEGGGGEAPGGLLQQPA